MDRRKLKGIRSLAIAISSAIAVVILLQQESRPGSMGYHAKAVMAVAFLGVCALLHSVYSFVPKRSHRFIPRFMGCCGALVASLLAGGYLCYIIPDPDWRKEPFLLFIGILFVGGALYAWWAVWRHLWRDGRSGISEPVDQAQDGGES
jgi:hypothetical protein